MGRSFLGDRPVLFGYSLRFCKFSLAPGLVKYTEFGWVFGYLGCYAESF
jgi:hypothetical protein